MKQNISKFLEFNGKNLLFLSKDGVYYIAIKPICEAIEVDYIRQFKNVSDDPILGPVLSKQTMQVPGDQARQMVCLPEQYIYGWLFSIRSESKELIEYKRRCYDILYDHFHGTITKRRNLIIDKVNTQNERAKLELKLRESEDFNKWEELKAREARIGKSMKDIDSEEISLQLSMFE